MSLSVAAQWSQVLALLIAVLTLIAVLMTLPRMSRQIRETVISQRAQVGPLPSFTIIVEPRDTNVVDYSTVNFVPVSRAWVRSAEEQNGWVAGENLATAYEDEEGRQGTLSAKINNLQEHPSGIIQWISIELWGWWEKKLETGKRKKQFVHLTGHFDLIQPKAHKNANIIILGNADTLFLYVRRLKYADMWGHIGEAFLGTDMAMYIGTYPNGKLLFADSTASFAEGDSKALISSRDSAFGRISWLFRWWLLKERFNRLRGQR